MAKSVKKKVPASIPEDTPAQQGCSWVPIQDRVIVARDPSEDVTEGGIILPDEAQHKPRYGTVLAVGPGLLRVHPLPLPDMADPLACLPDKETEEYKTYVQYRDYLPMQVKPGMRVVISDYSETVETDTKDVVILRESEILSIIR